MAFLLFVGLMGKGSLLAVFLAYSQQFSQQLYHIFSEINLIKRRKF